MAPCLAERYVPLQHGCHQSARPLGHLVAIVGKQLLYPSLLYLCIVLWFCVSSYPRAHGHTLTQGLWNACTIIYLSLSLSHTHTHAHTQLTHAALVTLLLTHQSIWDARLCTLMSPIGVLPSLMIKSKLWIPAKELAAISNSLTLWWWILVSLRVLCRRCTLCPKCCRVWEFIFCWKCAGNSVSSSTGFWKICSSNKSVSLNISTTCPKFVTTDKGCFSDFCSNLSVGSLGALSCCFWEPGMELTPLDKESRDIKVTNMFVLVCAMSCDILCTWTCAYFWRSYVSASRW